MTPYEQLFRTVSGRELLSVVSCYVGAMPRGRCHGVPLMTVQHDISAAMQEQVSTKALQECLEHLWTIGKVAAVARSGGLGTFLYWYRY